MSSRNSTKWSLVVLCCAVAVVLGACAKDTQSSSSGSSSGTTLLGNVVFPSTSSAPPSSETTVATIPPEARLPSGTEWPNAPDPCTLVSDQDVRQVTRFDMDALTRPGQTPTGGPTKVCLFKNRSADVNGGSLTITILPPGTDIEKDNAKMSEVESPGIGVRSVAGHLINNPTGGKGPNIVAVDMGNGGFSIGAFVFSDVEKEDILNLARQIAKNWKVEAK